MCAGPNGVFPYVLQAHHNGRHSAQLTVFAVRLMKVVIVAVEHQKSAEQMRSREAKNTKVYFQAVSLYEQQTC